jgi:hypothetical protein
MARKGTDSGPRVERINSTIPDGMQLLNVIGFFQDLYASLERIDTDDANASRVAFMGIGSEGELNVDIICPART